MGFRYTENFEWWDSVYDAAKNMAECIGIDIDEIYFSGFCSQGDGAMFIGSYSYKKGWKKALTSYAGDAEIMRIGQGLQDAQKTVFYGATASTTHRGHYYHECCMPVSVDMDDRISQAAFSQIEDDITECLRDFARWIYKQLEVEYEYLTSDGAVRGSIEASEMEFTADGEPL